VRRVKSNLRRALVSTVSSFFEGASPCALYSNNLLSFSYLLFLFRAALAHAGIRDISEKERRRFLLLLLRLLPTL